MAEMEEYTPSWDQGPQLDKGDYIWIVNVKKCTFRDIDKDKPFMVVEFVVSEGPQKDFEFDNRIYINKKAEWRVRWFLKKFDYPEKYLESAAPVLKKSVIEGLRGKVHVEMGEDNYGMLKADIKGFDHPNGTELEEKLAKKKGSEEQLPLRPASDSEPALPAKDVLDDVQGANDALDSLD